MKNARRPLRLPENFRQTVVLMNRLSVARLCAHKYSGEDYRSEACLDFIDTLKHINKDAWVVSSNAQLLIRKEFHTHMLALFKNTDHVKSFRKRVVVFRALVKEWYDKMVQVNEGSILAQP